ncbi:hypothetical protein ACFYTC_19425 [Actinomadura nitritigenes]|uniref:hypothetical protein n=1 Tax=Actinomadura nitritigenes TaxID=134602 RepID=UPI003692CA17
MHGLLEDAGALSAIVDAAQVAGRIGVRFAGAAFTESRQPGGWWRFGAAVAYEVHVYEGMAERAMAGRTARRAGLGGSRRHHRGLQDQPLERRLPDVGRPIQPERRALGVGIGVLWQLEAEVPFQAEALHWLASRRQGCRGGVVP